MAAHLSWTSEQTAIRTLLSEINDGLYDLNPVHQRNVVHNLKWKRNLIKSIFEPPCAIPETWWHPVTDTEGNNILTSVDGKQRITAIQEFRNGVFRWNDAYFLDLSPADKNHFLNHRLSVRIANRTLIESEIHRTFSILQMTKKTTTGEVVNSETGPFRSCIAEMIKSHESFLKRIFRNDKRNLIIETYSKAFNLWYRLEHDMALKFEPGDVVYINHKVSENWQEENENINFSKFGELILTTWEILCHGKNFKIHRKMNATTWLPIFQILCENKYNDISEYLNIYLFDLVQKWPNVAGNHNAVSMRKEILDEELFEVLESRD